MKKKGFWADLWGSILLLFERTNEDRLASEASSLAYQSFLAIVPLLAVMLGIAKGFGLEEALHNWLSREFETQQEVLSHLLRLGQTTLQETSGGVVAGIGVFFLLFTSVRLLSSVEFSFNTMWGGVRGRLWSRRISDYISLVLICPFLLALSSSLTVYVTTYVTYVTESLPLLTPAQPLLSKALQLLSVVSSALLFSIVLYALPCAPVAVFPAVVSGTIMAVFFHLFQSWYVYLQLHLTKIGAIYGSLVAIPLFLIWLWVSWFLVLLAGELLVFLHEKGWRRSVYAFEVNHLTDLEADIAVLALIKRRLDEGAPPYLKDLYQTLSLPIRAITRSLRRLEYRGLICDDGVDARIVPTQSLEEMTLAELLLAEKEYGLESSMFLELSKKWRKELQKEVFTLNLDFLKL